MFNYMRTQAEGSRFALLALLTPVLLAFAGIGLMRTGLYGLTLFALLPVVIGAAASWYYRPATAWQALKIGMISTAIASLSLLAIGLEGLICVAMALPLVLPLGALGSWLVYQARASKQQLRGGAALLLLVGPSTMAWDTQAKPDVFEVHSSIEIAASPEQVWKHVVSFSDLPEPQEWYFRSGLAYLKRARIEGSGPGAVRYCEFSTGPFVEPIEVWNEPHLLRFRVTENPAPMHEWSPYGEILPKHLHGYMISKRGQFRLTRLANNHTLLEGNTWYQHGLWPGQYWSWWSSAVIHRIHLRVLNHIRLLAEKEARDL